jgi:hypothetical protein
MQSTASLITAACRSTPQKEPGPRAPNENDSGVSLGLQDLATAVETGRADVMTQVRFAGGRLDGRARVVQRIVSAVHATLRRGFFVLLNSHEILLGPAFARGQLRST